jgi:hypothetical protein
MAGWKNSIGFFGPATKGHTSHGKAVGFGGNSSFIIPFEPSPRTGIIVPLDFS